MNRSNGGIRAPNGSKKRFEVRFSVKFQQISKFDYQTENHVTCAIFSLKKLFSLDICLQTAGSAGPGGIYVRLGMRKAIVVGSLFWSFPVAGRMKSSNPVIII